jgi:hypothetical protein
MLSNLRIDLNRFEKFINPHNPDSVSYNNKEEGIGIGTKSNGEVVVIEYFPAAKDSHLRCPNFRPDQLSNDEMQYYKFDEYSNIPFSDEKARLDNLAIHLRREPKLIGYIITYAGRQARAGEAKARAVRAENYLVSERGIEPERVVTVDGGYREKPRVELYLLPRDVSPPTPYPTVAPGEVQIIKAGRRRSNRRVMRLRKYDYDKNN